jgi:hypothetical protein
MRAIQANGDLRAAALGQPDGIAQACAAAGSNGATSGER